MIVGLQIAENWDIIPHFWFHFWYLFCTPIATIFSFELAAYFAKKRYHILASNLSPIQ